MKMMIEVDDDALELLDKYIHKVYSHRCWVTNNPEMYFWEQEIQEQSKREVGNTKVVAKAFGLYPYNQKEVRHP